MAQRVEMYKNSFRLVIPRGISGAQIQMAHISIISNDALCVLGRTFQTPSLRNVTLKNHHKPIPKPHGGIIKHFIQRQSSRNGTSPQAAGSLKLMMIMPVHSQLDYR